MKSNVCYCSVDGTRGIVRNRDNTAGAPPPELVMGLPCELRLRLFANCADTTPYPMENLAGIVGWSFAMDTDFSPLSTVKLVARNADIRLEEITENGIVCTQFTIPLPETHTTELEAALGGRESISLDGELIGYDSGHDEAFVLQIKGFVVRGRLSGLGGSIPVLSAVCEAMAEEAIDSALAGKGYVVSSGAELIASGAVADASSALDSRITNVSGGLQTQLDTLSGGLAPRPTSGGAELIASGAAVAVLNASALRKNQPFSTTVGTYTVEHTESGLEVRDENGGCNVVISSGYIEARTWDELSEETNTLLVTPGGITAGGSAITQATSEFDGTSLGIDALTGGVKYVCASALTALSVGSAAPGCNATIFFTLISGGTVTPPSNVPYFGVTSYTAGSSYVMAINGDMAVCVEAVSAGV